MPLSNPFSMQDQHHSIVICPPPPPSPSNNSTTQLSYVPPLPPSPTKVSITQLSDIPTSTPFSLKGQHHSTVMSLLYPLLPQRSKPLNCHMCPSTPLSQKGQHKSTVKCPPSAPFQFKSHYHSTVICPPLLLINQRSAPLNCQTSRHLPPSPSKVSITQLSYVPPPPSSPSKISTTQLSYVPSIPHSTSKVPITQLVLCPLYPLLNQRSAPLNCPVSPSTPFSLKCQHHSTVFCPRHPFSIKGQHNSTVICLSLTPSQCKISTTQLSYVPLRPLLPQMSAPLKCHMSPLSLLLPQRSASPN